MVMNFMLDRGKLFFQKTKKHIKAIIVVHVFGNLADMEKIMEIAQKYGLEGSVCLGR